MRARGRRPSARARSASASSTAAAPSEICDDVPAVCRPPSTTGLSRASAARLVSRRPSSRSSTRVSPLGWPPAPRTGALTGTTSRSKRPSAHAARASVWDRRPNASVSSRDRPRRAAMRSAPTYWFGRSISHDAGRGEPMSVPTAARSGIRLIVSTPQAIPTPIASAAMRPATRWAACCAEPHWASRVRQPHLYGSPACSQAVRVMLLDCSPAWVTHPPATCSTSAGSRPARSSSAAWTPPRSSAGCTPASAPPRFPTGVRTASTIMALPMAHP